MAYPHLSEWVEEMARLCKPDHVHWCTGSEQEQRRLTDLAVSTGALILLNPSKHPNSFLHRSSPNDVARSEQLTFICSRQEVDAGPTNNWMSPTSAYARLGKLFAGSMRGRTMYVVPYLMGPLGSPYSRVGVELTDSVYVVLNMRIMTRMGEAALGALGAASADFNRGLHCTGDLDPERRFICHFPEDNTIWSYGSGYGGNALLGKKCLALRLASYQGRREGWLAEHMLILGAEDPQGRTTYVAAAFPSACGKTNFSMMAPPPRFEGWKLWTVGDDIAWLHVGPDGRLWAVNPERGYFGVAPGTNLRSNPNAMRAVSHDALFTNVAMTLDGGVWWEGLEAEEPAELIDWQGRPWKKGSPEPAAHPNSRFTVPATNNPVYSPAADEPHGVPISAILFGGRRSTTVPLVLQSIDWDHGVFLGATMGSETTAAGDGKLGVLRRDPMAMLPFCGYNMGDYMRHWLRLRRRLAAPPLIFQVNWFRRDQEGQLLWPGYGENMRVLKWIIERVQGTGGARQTPFGFVPKPSHLDLSGLDLAPERVEEATSLVEGELKAELESLAPFFERLGERLPETFSRLRRLLLSRLG